MTRGWLVALALLAGGCARDCGVNAIDLERMMDQAKVEAQEPTRFFPDGRGMRPLVDGVVPTSRPTGTIATGREQGQPVARLPMPVTRALVERGRDRYDIFCAVCHGDVGDGRSQVAENMQLVKPPSLISAKMREYPDGRFFVVITEGYGLMPSYAAELPVEDRWAVVAYVRALQLSQGARLPDLPPEAQKEAEPWLR